MAASIKAMERGEPRARHEGTSGYRRGHIGPAGTPGTPARTIAERAGFANVTRCYMSVRLRASPLQPAGSSAK
jgi:hypothetical protein